MKKVTTFVLAMVFACLCLASCKGAPATESDKSVNEPEVDKTTLTLSCVKHEDDTITAIINCAAKPGQELSGVQFDLEFDEDILEPVLKDKQTDYYNEKLSSYGVCLANARGNSIRFMAADISFKNPIVGASDIVTVEFRVKGELSAAALSLTGVEFTDMDGQIVDSQIKTNIQ